MRTSNELLSDWLRPSLSLPLAGFQKRTFSCNLKASFQFPLKVLF